MHSKRRTVDRLERLERSILGLMLMGAVAWAVAGGHSADTPHAPVFATASSR